MAAEFDKIDRWQLRFGKRRPGCKWRSSFSRKTHCDMFPLWITIRGQSYHWDNFGTYSNGSPKVSRFSWRRKTILVAARRETWQFWSRRELHFSLLDERLSILVATCCYEAPQDLLISGRHKMLSVVYLHQCFVFPLIRWVFIIEKM